MHDKIYDGDKPMLLWLPSRLGFYDFWELHLATMIFEDTYAEIGLIAYCN